MNKADESHAKLERALTILEEKSAGETKDPHGMDIALEGVRSFALASIALELRELRLSGGRLPLGGIFESTEPATERSAKVQRDALDDDAF